MGIYDSDIRKEIRAVKARMDGALMSCGNDFSGDPCSSRISGYEKQLNSLNGQLASRRGGVIPEGFMRNAMRILERS